MLVDGTFEKTMGGSMSKPLMYAIAEMNALTLNEQRAIIKQAIMLNVIENHKTVIEKLEEDTTNVSFADMEAHNKIYKEHPDLVETISVELEDILLVYLTENDRE